ncbi:GNAT family protein [Actinoplanes sp. NPDC049668]|uniref:GNAT family N-acetyltransferase n=1 Tax=unclassified Actinoplanes TaxID=2626549 RepID=UPI0033A198EA
MITEYWPLFGLTLRTPRLELRVPGLEDLARLAAAAAAGVHEPDRQPFAVPWTDGTPAERARNTLQWQWSMWGRWTPQDWSLNFVTVADGQVIGTQAIDAKDFAGLREVGSGSWLGREYQGKGYGTEMRAAVLDLAFTGLGAEWATSEAFADNVASYRVSRRLGYTDDGTARHLVRGEPVVGRRLRLDRAGWAAARTVDVRIEGLEPCLPLFGL